MQKSLPDEAKAIAKLIGLTFEHSSSTMIEHTIRKLVLSEVITSYTLIDDLMNDIIIDFFISPANGSDDDFEARRIFQQFILDETYPLKKLALIAQFADVPKPIKGALQHINDIRNALAHSFAPEMRKEHAPKNMVTYRGERLFCESGLTVFLKDATLVIGHLNEISFSQEAVASLQSSHPSQ